MQTAVVAMLFQTSKTSSIKLMDGMSLSMPRIKRTYLCKLAASASSTSNLFVTVPTLLALETLEPMAGLGSPGIVEGKDSGTCI